jgi:hypothetical protein
MSGLASYPKCQSEYTYADGIPLMGFWQSGD